MELTVGIDLVAVSDVEASIDAHAARYLQRIYTAQELSDCQRADGAPDATRLAARFAAKEATLKALQVGDEPVPWHSIAVTRGRHGAPALELSGAAAALAQRRGVQTLALSLTHEGQFAAAIVVAQSGGGDDLAITAE
jgi:holo-[acyl-carrier protein] synthase